MPTLTLPTHHRLDSIHIARVRVATPVPTLPTQETFGCLQKPAFNCVTRRVASSSLTRTPNHPADSAGETGDSRCPKARY